MAKKGAPAPTDFTSAATAQGAANVDAARASSWLNNPNVTNAYGTHTVSADPNNPDHMNVTDQLNPFQQNIFDINQATQTGLAQAANQYGLPAIFKSLNTSYGLPGSPMTDFSSKYAPTVPFQYDQEVGQSPNLKGTLDFSGAPAMPTADRGVRDQVTQSVYDQGAQYLDRQFDQKQKALASALSNQGIFRGNTPSGNTAYENANHDLSDQSQQAYGDLRDRAVQAGGDAMQQLFNMGMSARQEGVGEIGAQGAFQNAARQQELASMANAQAGHNAAVGQGYGVAGAQAALANSGRAQQFQENTTASTLPINIITALMSGSQVGNPNFQPYQGGASVQPAPIFQGAQATAQSGINSYNAGQAALGNWLNLGGSLAGAGIRSSDRRLKTDVRLIGTTVHELPLYSYKINGKWTTGVMADEVEKVMPAAVSTQADGYKAVDYAMLGIPDYGR